MRKLKVLKRACDDGSKGLFIALEACFDYFMLHHYGAASINRLSAIAYIVNQLRNNFRHKESDLREHHTTQAETS